MTVTTSVVVQPESVQVIMVVPADKPVITPVVVPMVEIMATDGLLLVQVHPAGAVSVVLLPTHAMEGPEMTGSGFTLIVTRYMTDDGHAHAALLVISTSTISPLAGV